MKKRFPIGTGTSAKPRVGTGKVIRFRVEGGTAIVGIERDNGQRVVLSCEIDLAHRILDQYGYRESPSFRSVNPMIGLPVRYKETATGMLVEMEVLPN